MERLPFIRNRVKIERRPFKRKILRRPFSLSTATKKRIERRLYQYEPVYKGALEGFSVNFITKNMWKVQDRYELTDCMQDAYMLFLRCKEKYCTLAAPGQRVTHPAHFMALYKTTLLNHITVLANETSNQRQYLLDEKIDYDFMTTLVSKAKGDEQNAGYLNRMIEQAPKNVRDLIELVTTKREALESAWKRHRASGGKAESGNVFLCKCLGLNPLTHNVVREVKEYFHR